MQAPPPRVPARHGGRRHAAVDGAGASRFTVVFSRTSGSRKQRAKREGAIVVRYDVAYLYDTDNHECVLRCKASGAGPNAVFARMQRAHRGADWRVGTELSLCGFDVVVEEVMELHLIPYEEDVDAAAALDGVEHEAVPAADCADAAVHSAAVLRHRARAAASRTPVLTPFPAATATGPVPWPADRAATLAQCSSAHETASPSAPSDSSPGDGGTYALAAPLQRARRRRRRSTASLARELRRCYPQHF